MKKTKTLSLLAGSLFALALISAKVWADTPAESWGDLGYTHPESKVETEPLNNDEIASTIAADQQQQQQQQKTPVEKGVTDISSVQNTYGVETEERNPITFYAAPFAGVSSLLGADSVDSSFQYAVGGSVGVLLSDRFLIEGSFTHVETNVTSLPVFGATTTTLFGGAMLLKQNVISAGGKFFVLGRESRVRPFIGGGADYNRGTLNYASPFAHLNDLTINQYQAFGDIGAEVGITRNIVASALFQINGNLSSDYNSSSGADTARLNAGSSVSRTASYLIAGGVGIYF